jgi:hypothetical protein
LTQDILTTSIVQCTACPSPPIHLLTMSLSQILAVALLFVGADAQPPSSATCSNPTCSSPPCAASQYGDVGCTTVSGTSTYDHELLTKGDTIASNAHIFGPFEAGFSSMQKSIIEGWGCTDATVAYDTAGGLDISIAMRKVAYVCNIQLPRTSGNTYYGIVGPCGGHTSDYHFHTLYSCLYSASGAHSTAVGNVGSWKLYGKWEDYANKKLPLLDACGAHFGVTPDSGSATVYHHHVQDKPPFAVGCHGPTADNKLVGVAACRSLYSTCSASAETMTVAKDATVPTVTETVSYVRSCPCFDANGLNTGSISELAALSTTEISCTSSDGVTCDTSSGGTTTTTTTTSGPTTTTTSGPTTTTTTGPTTTTASVVASQTSSAHRVQLVMGLLGSAIPALLV